TQGAQDMMRLNEFIKSLEWWKLVPGGLDGMKDIIVDPANADTTASFVSAAAARDGSFLVAYIPPAHDGRIRVDLTVLSKPGFAYWFDPTDGRYLPVKGSPIRNNSVKEFITPGKNSVGESDWVLLVKTTGEFLLYIRIFSETRDRVRANRRRWVPPHSHFLSCCPLRSHSHTHTVLSRCSFTSLRANTRCASKVNFLWRATMPTF